MLCNEGWRGYFRGMSGDCYRITRFVILRLLGFVYAVAFLVAAKQIIPLIGAHGLTPAVSYLDLLAAHYGSRGEAAFFVPSLFWLGISDQALLAFAWIGLGLSLVVVAGYANSILMAALWMIYMSFVHVGQIWYSYGWEIQLLETGFLAIFLCPLLDMRPFPKSPPSVVVIWLYRWLGFRIMLGAGLIKLRGDACWRDLTCLYYHYETQPIPNPLSPFFHFAPHWVLKCEVAWNHSIELVVPWFSFGPQRFRHVAGALLVSFQVILILSGNLSFLNWLTIVPFLACFDDTLLRPVLPGFVVGKAGEPCREASATERNTAIGLATVIGVLSIMPVLNLVSGMQVMNGSFDPFDIVNTYGAFGSVGKERYEVIFQGTNDTTITDQTQWKEYEFPCKPGDPMRRPCIISPYQPRLDWQIWFAAMASPAEYPWTVHFVWKLLHNDPGTLSLLAGNPFPDAPPHWIRARLYRYRFAPPGSKAWWLREDVGEWLPAVSVEDVGLKGYLAAHGWNDAGY